jgi:hypothetical protein
MMHEIKTEDLGIDSPFEILSLGMKLVGDDG